VDLAFGDVDDLGGMQAVEVVIVRGLLGRQRLDQPEQAAETSLPFAVAGDLAASVAIDLSELGLETLQLPALAAALLGVGIACGLGRSRLGQLRVALAQRDAGQRPTANSSDRPQACLR